MNKNIIWHNSNISKENRRELNRHKSFIIWFTGLSASGKSTLAHSLDEYFYKRNIRSYVLDGDNVRQGLNKDLGFSDIDRTENIRRIGEVAKLFVDSGLIVLTAFISPFTNDRNQVRNLVEDTEFIEIFVKCPIEICEKRDPKGLYKKAKEGLIKEFTGIDSPYEEPFNPEIVIETDKLSIEKSVEKIVSFLIEKGLISD